MNRLYLIAAAVVSLSYANSTQSKPLEKTTSVRISDSCYSDSSKWKDSFLELSKAIRAGNKDAVKSFIDFPIKNNGNEIWYLADPRLVREIRPDKIKPFTETDFDKYFSSIFTLDLRETLEKLDTGQFFKTHKGSRPEIVVVKDTKSKLEASFDGAKHKITLTMVTDLGNSKFRVYYRLDVLNDEKIRFRQVHLE